MRYLTEDKRTELVAQGRKGEKELDGFSRYEKRIRSKIAPSVKQYNKINMDNLFRNNILTVSIDIKGETDNYIVTISFGGFLDELHEQLQKNNDKLELKVIIRALVNAFNSDNVYLRCSCPDFKYRFAFWASKNDIITGDKETRPSKITNPRNSKGPACKHVMLVLANHSFLIKVASVINNYIKYFEKYREKQYADIIYPAIYQRDYNKDVQTNMFDDDSIETDSDILDIANKEGALSGRFKSDLSNPSIRKALERDIQRKKALANVEEDNE